VLNFTSVPLKILDGELDYKNLEQNKKLGHFRNRTLYVW